MNLRQRLHKNSIFSQSQSLGLTQNQRSLAQAIFFAKMAVNLLSLKNFNSRLELSDQHLDGHLSNFEISNFQTISKSSDLIHLFLEKLR